MPGPETIVDGDPHRLNQLLDNLIANAIRFTPAGGTVTVRVRDHRGSVSLEIDDTGAGIPDVDRERLFEAFTRGATTDAPGTGLGLSIVKAIADATAQPWTYGAGRATAPVSRSPSIDAPASRPRHDRPALPASHLDSRSSALA